MNKAVPWNINGVGFDAREAAREAARRQGKSLGEWLHAVIADQAGDIGSADEQTAERGRIEAVTARLERMSGRAVAAEHRPRVVRSDEASTRVDLSRRRRDEDEDEQSLRRRTPRRDPDDLGAKRRPASVDEAEYLLEEAVDAMERRAARAERRTDSTLDSFARLLEVSEAKREGERDAVRDLTQKLAEIETRLFQRPGHPEEGTLIKGALARLEARLETISRKSSAERRLDDDASVDPRVDVEPIRRLEDKLNTILDAVAPRAGEAAPAGRPVAHRRLGDAIAEISQRQKALELGKPESRGQGQGRRSQPMLVRGLIEDAPWQRSLAAMQAEIGSLAAKIEDMTHGLARRATPAESAIDLDRMRTEIGAMSKALQELAPRGSVTQLRTSIDSLMQRVETSREDGVGEGVLRPVELAVGHLRGRLPSIDPRPTLGLMEREVDAIAARIDTLPGAHPSSATLASLQDQMKEIRDLLATTVARPLPVEQIERQVVALSDQMDAAAHRSDAGPALGTAAETLAAMVAGAPTTGGLDKIEARLEALARKIDDAAAPPPESGRDVAGLERLVRDLGAKIEAVRSPDADTRSIEALQRQVEQLAQRFERSETGLASLAGLEHSMRDLFAHLEETRVAVESTAGKAAREVLRIAADEGRGHPSRRETSDAGALKDLQSEADRRTQSTLNAVHQTLEHVVGRMSAMETDLATMRGAPAASMLTPKPAPGAPKRQPQAEKAFDMTLGMIDPLVDPLFSKTKNEAAKVRPARPKAPTPEDDAGRADFIAAARRAAKAAQTDPSVTALKQDGASRAETRVSLQTRSRDYVATHKRPVLLSVAAVFVVLGTMAIVQRMAFDNSDAQMASGVPARVERMAESTPRPTSSRPSTVVATTGDLTPSALPTGARALAAQIPGSDPAPTSSIQSLPSFAAQGAAPPAPARPALPAGLVAMAETGDGAAEYELGSRYAEGRLVPRDLKTAASWYQRAADQGLAPAEYRLAALYEKGLGVAQDKRRARGLYQRAADAGNPRAMHNLAVLLADGDGKPDYASAATWFRKAAQYGIHDSQYNLAILLARGLGVERSMVQSYQWFAIAAAQNDTDAAKKRDEVGDKLSANDLAVAKALAAAFQPRSADVAAVEVAPPPGGWDSVGASSHVSSARSKISSLL